MKADRYTDAVAKAVGMTAPQKLVLYTLARFTNNETGVCWPGQTLVANLSCVSYSTAQRAIDVLTELGHIKETGKHPLRGATALFTKEYTLQLDSIKAASFYAESDGSSIFW